MRFEEKYQDVLQNIEFAIVSVYRDHPELTDYDIADAVQALTRQYVAEAAKRYQPYTNLSDRANLVVQAAKNMCDWRLGRNTFETQEGEKIASPNNTLDEIIACLKRIHKSVQFWTKEGGRQGYLKFVSKYI
ncbi:hypothetical protein FBQ85_05860 [Cytophagia bacterium CHB2]|nr:hypothetical protein [Cytophagia bacterium CHB2]